MNDLRTLFSDAASGAPAATTLTRDVLARAGRDRRRATRRRATLVAAAGATAVAAGALVVLDEPVPRRAPLRVALGANGAVQVVPAGKRGCGGFAEAVPGAEVPEELRLVSRDPALRQARPALARRVTGRCGTAAIALALLDLDARGLTRRGLTLSGPLPAPLDTGGYEHVREVALRGGRGRVVTLSGAASMVAWTERGGGSWALHSTGNDVATLVTYADALVLADDGTATLPPALARGYRDLGPSPAVPAGSRYAWSVTYAGRGYEVDLDVQQVTGTVLSGLPGSPAGLAREVTVNGVPGVHSTNGATFGSGLQLLSWGVSPGIVATTSGVGLTYEQLVAVTRTLRPAPADDPAVTGAR